MDAISAEAGVTKPILYRHFGDKDGLYRALAEERTDDLLRRLRAAMTVRGGRRQRTEAAIDAYLAEIQSEPEMYRFLVRFPTGAAVAGTMTTFRGRLASELAGALRADGVKRDLADLWAVAIVGMVESAGEWWLDSRPFSRRRMVRRMTDLLWGAFGD